MNGPLRVSTACPTCGASIDFEEGTQAFRCGFCGSMLWITGYHRTLTYSISERISAEKAAATAVGELRARYPGFRLAEVLLVFLPFYRFSGAAFWLDPEEERANELSEEERKTIRDALAMAGKFGGTRESGDQRWTLKTRRVEKTFPAFDLGISDLYSLGVRASVLPLSIFQPELLTKRGRLIPVGRPEGEALEIGRKQESSGRALRAMEGRLSLIYFPFYLASCEKGEERCTLFLDAVSGQLASSDQRAFALPQGATPDSFSVIRFRPLKCPNCGWGLPVRPLDVILACSTCGRAWQAGGEDLLEVPAQFESAPQGTHPKELRYLPFWVMAAEANDMPQGIPANGLLRVPAVASRNFHGIGQMALALMRSQVPISPAPFESGPCLEGCSYTKGEAQKIAGEILLLHLLQKGLPIEKAEKVSWRLGDPALVWSPFTARGVDYIEPRTGFGVLKNLLL